MFTNNHGIIHPSAFTNLLFPLIYWITFVCDYMRFSPTPKTHISDCILIHFNRLESKPKVCFPLTVFRNNPSVIITKENSCQGHFIGLKRMPLQRKDLSIIHYWEAKMNKKSTLHKARIGYFSIHFLRGQSNNHF